MAVAIDWATLAAALVEAICYGAFSILFGFTLYVLVYKRNGPINNLLLGALILMYVLATAHMGVVMARAVIGFVIVREKPGGTTAYLAIVSNASNLVRSALYQTQTLVGDACMIYRCFIVWQRRPGIVALPLFLLAACAVTGYGIVIAFSKGQSAHNVYTFGPWIDAFFATSLATNMYCTVMIALRIWIADRATGEFRQTENPLKPVVIIVIESGAIYSSMLLGLMTSYLMNSWIHFVFLDVMTPVIGIVFSMIITRIGLSLAWKNKDKGSSLSVLRPGRKSSVVFKPSKSTMPDVIHVTTTVEERFDEPTDDSKDDSSWARNSDHDPGAV